MLEKHISFYQQNPSLANVMAPGIKKSAVEHKFVGLESPSVHGAIFVGVLTEPIPVRIIASNEENSNIPAKETVQENWDKRIKELADENPEFSVTGILLFYPTYIISYCESGEDGLRHCLQLLKTLLSRDSSKLQSVKVVYIQHNLSSRLFSSLYVRSFELPPERSNDNYIHTKKSRTATHENRLQLVRQIFQLIMFIRKQAPLSVRKSLDLIGEKMTSLLPDPALVDVLIDDEMIPDPLVYMSKKFEQTVVLAEDTVWPVPKETFQLNVIL